MSSPMTTPKYQLIELKLGRDLAAYLQSGRERGLSLRQLAAALSTETGTEVSYELVRSWLALTEPAAS